MRSALARELRENRVYLQDAGWAATAALMEIAAAEIERLADRVAELERRELGRASAAQNGLLLSISRLWTRNS